MGKHEKILSGLSIEDKAAFLSQYVIEWTDISKYGLQPIHLADGPSGIRRMRTPHSDDLPLICYPSVSTYACSWNRDLMKELGHYLGVEARMEGIDILLGPGCNIKRSPLGGRNFEYYSEDPVLTGELATNYIEGLQEEGVGACVKHFAANNQETRRMTIDEMIESRALHEIYLKAFRNPILKAKPYMVMTAYNRINGEYCAEHTEILKKTLRDEWGYEGAVITDCLGAHHLDIAIKNGLNLQMASGTAEHMAEQITELIEQGKISEAEIDTVVGQTIDLLVKCNGTKKSVNYEPVDHRAFAQRIAEESIVLLKNDELFFPLNHQQSIAVIGKMAMELRYQGGGSAHLDGVNSGQIYEEVKKLCPNAMFAEGYIWEENNEHKIEEALEVAKLSQKVLLCLGLPEEYESEGYDREHMRLPACQNELLAKILEVNQNIAVILLHGSPVEMPWKDEVKAILDAYLPGEAGAAAVANILFGKVNPSGKLAESIPVKLSDTPCYLNFPGRRNSVSYAEGIYVGYRYYDKKEMDVAYPFGHGISYTTYQYDKLQICNDGNSVKVNVEVTNSGQTAGKEVVQVYVKKPGKYYDCPIRELVDFQKVSLSPGEMKRLTFELSEECYKVYDSETKRWAMEGGCYRIEVGSSSRDIRQTGTVYLMAKQTLPEITEDTSMSDLIEIYGKYDQLEILLKAYAKSYQNLQLCRVENPQTRAFAGSMSFLALQKSDNQMKEQDIKRILERLNHS